ncbi:MAG: BatA and WFA domain-containing protein [Anaerolineae bacterium]
MSFLAPAALALASLIPVVIAMYLLKLRRTEQVVSSIYLWRRMVRDLEANAPWQRLQRNWLLILQVLFLATLILALARPFSWAEGASGQALILILDTSASMAATDVAPSRLGAAKAQARKLVDGQPDDARITLITASDRAQVLLASSQDRRQAHHAIEGLATGAGGSDMAAALELASALAARQPETEIVVLSDGRVNLPERLATRGQIRFLPVGQSGQNQAISTLSLEPASGGETLTAFAQITNYGDSLARRRLTLHADGRLVNAYDLQIAPGDQAAVVAEALPGGTRVLEARLEGEDVLSLDDRAWAVARQSQPASVTLVSEGNLFLETGLSLLPGLELTTVRPADYEAGRQADGLEDRDKPGGDEGNSTISPSTSPPVAQPPTLTIFDTYVPISATLPAGNLLFIAPLQGTEYFSVTGQLDQPLLQAVDREDDLLAHVNLAEVNVLDAAQIPLPYWARPVIVAAFPADAGQVTGEEQAQAPLLFAGEVDGRRVAVLAFDLRRSDLPLHTAFPLLLANLSSWLAPGTGGDLPAQVHPGAAVTLSLPPGAVSARVTRPDGAVTRLLPGQGQAVFADTQQLGVYQVTWERPQASEESEARQALFAVNLFSPQESDVRPAETLPIPGGDEARLEQRPGQVRREWWRPLTLAALLILSAEWLVYQRASLARLWASVKRRVRNGEQKAGSAEHRA